MAMEAMGRIQTDRTVAVIFPNVEFVMALAPGVYGMTFVPESVV